MSTASSFDIRARRANLHGWQRRGRQRRHRAQPARTKTHTSSGVTSGASPKRVEGRPRRSRFFLPPVSPPLPAPRLGIEPSLTRMRVPKKVRRKTQAIWVFDPLPDWESNPAQFTGQRAYEAAVCMSRGHSHDCSTYQIPLIVWSGLCGCSAFPLGPPLRF